MTTSYLTKITITDDTIIVESFIGAEHKIASFGRGPRENQTLSLALIGHKQSADVILNTSTEAEIDARKGLDLKIETLSLSAQSE